MSLSKVAVFHPGTQHSWQTARALQELDRLQWFASSLVYNPNQFPYWLERLPGPVGRKFRYEFGRLQARGLDASLIRSAGTAEWFERIAARLGMNGLARSLDAWGNRRFGAVLSSEVASAAPFALWGFNGSSRTTFELGKRHGRLCILDRTLGHGREFNQVMSGLRGESPEWFLTAGPPVSEDVLADNEAEFALADRIVVGSQTAADTILRSSGVAELSAKLAVLPYCFDSELFAAQPAPQPADPTEPVRFLMVGELGPRKGIHLLLEAISRIPPDKASLTLVGPLAVPPRTFAQYAGRVTHVPHVPRSEIPGIMAAHQVLVFPSYFEGSALSLLEGLASGLALIQSRQAGQGVTPACGLMLDELTVDAVVDAMWLPIRDRALLYKWRISAQAEAQNYTFTRYRANIEDLLQSAGL